MTIFINIIPKDLLALFVYKINIIHNQYFLLTRYATPRLAKGFHIHPVLRYPLFFQIIYIEYIIAIDIHGFIVFVNNRIN